MLDRSSILTIGELNRQQQAAVLESLVEGNSIRATNRMVGVAKGSILRLLEVVGAHCKNHHDRFVRHGSAKRVECDEIWSFVGAKGKHVPVERRGTGEHGDIWTWTAICAETKLVPYYRVGRDADEHDLAARLASRVQLTTDGLSIYFRPVEEAFGWAKVDYAQLVKIYGVPTGSEGAAHRRYSPAECIGIKKEGVMGNPDEKYVSTSSVERQNLIMRMSMRRFTRLTKRLLEEG